MLTRFTIILVLLGLFSAIPCSGWSPYSSPEVWKIAQAIRVVNPHLNEHKYLVHATHIYRASRKYDIDPNVLIAIAQQESTFRDRLPEGKAGERGMCQVLKKWKNHPEFQKEFGQLRDRDFDKPANSFLFAAWILKQLAMELQKPGPLPAWSYYNSRKFDYRLRYFISVNRYYSTLVKWERKRSARLALMASTMTNSPEQIAD